MIQTRRTVHRVDASGLAPASDELAAEAPLELRVAGEPVYVTMRTPGNDVELINGLLIAEGVITAEQTDLVTVRENEAHLDMDLAEFKKSWPERSLYASSACGVCGATAVDALAADIEPIGASPLIPIEQVAEAPDRMRRQQPLFDATGAVHAAGMFDSTGELLAVREDVGRHNAVDKLVGWAAAANHLPATDCMLVVSGRVSFEIAHKAARAQVPVVVAVSAPTTLAVDVAERFRLTICGFARAGRFNVYSHPARLDFG